MPLPRFPDDGTTSGSTARSTPNSVRSSSSHEPESRSRSIVRDAFVRSVTCAAPPAQLPDQPGVDRPEGQLLLRPLGVPEDPLELRRREVVRDEPRPLADQTGGQPAQRSGAPVLPHDRTVHRPAGTALPHHGRLALIGDPDRVEVAGVRAGRGERVRRGRLDARPDLLRVVLGPTPAAGSAARAPGTRVRGCAAPRRRRDTSFRSVPWLIARITAVVDQHPSDAYDG